MNSVELFVGAGGLGMGLTKAGFDPQIVVEWNEDACKTIIANQARGVAEVRGWPVKRMDVSDFHYSSISEKIELVSGGPPCQPFSLGGKHKAYDDSRDMFPQAIRAVRELSPTAFIFENVKGLKRQTFAKYLECIRLQLTFPEFVKKQGESWEDHLVRLEEHSKSGVECGLKYQVGIRLLNAADYGVPQLRERVFIVGFSTDQGIEWTFPGCTHSREALFWDQYVTGEYWERHKILSRHRPELPKAEPSRIDRIKAAGAPNTLPWKTVRDALVGLPDPEQQDSSSQSFHNHEFRGGARVYAGHTGSKIDEPAKTLKAGDHGVPGGENMMVKTDGSVRYFTVRESARLQTFPDSYCFHGSWSEAMRQLGNAVPVLLAEAVAKSVYSAIAKKNTVA
jgi:DNA (cytosine-5)-methyltransferase 1